MNYSLCEGKGCNNIKGPYDEPVSVAEAVADSVASIRPTILSILSIVIFFLQ